ncbi:hypothetical protein K505DRAFT_347869 [Melanomma pulvis-pyrius CBS 109.77]|uniref:Frequency clock protein n=1 Tax=Melanomma pulvis-pyrius CBS 109.77 TaxID=1314802 RepID=A0A6A6XJ62_9PLEO|nr:hypothetical protein K505DRAFT_347869 [Melanomma pulvis-pyrius CBS 109.77]
MDHTRNTTSRQPSHPRRPPAHESVTLRHDQPGRPSPAPASDQANPPSTISPELPAKNQSSGESSDAGHWYENTNNNAIQSNASFIDNDPPFFLRNSSSSATPPERHEMRSTHILPQSTAVPHRPGMLRRDTDTSSAEEYRNVIDDLTVANKMLKQKLRKYERLYDAHLQSEKLLEVRFHGLPDHKKRELEEYLQKFAADMDGTANDGYQPTSYAPLLAAQKSTYSHTSRVAESGYASISASGQNSTSAPIGQEHDRRKMSELQYKEQQQSIRSYLHDIPVGLLPQRNAPMTEKSKKKLVVRRLEQIFAGKLSAPGSHQHPIQQEEVAQSAAMADRRAKEATGQQSRLEGLREARIMTTESEDENTPFAPALEALPRPPSALLINNQELSGSGSPDQRPTRPLDLDPYRAQVPAENIEYIRHLGFTPPNVVSGEALEDGHGWLYLNLLIGMAQLHTYNVTNDFVKDAVSEFSSKFELSHDGRKVRWRGDQDVMMGSSDSSSEQLSNSPLGIIAGSSPMSPAKRLKSRNRGESSGSKLGLEWRARRTVRPVKKQVEGKLAYTPLFFHKDVSEEEGDFYNLDMSSSNNSPLLAQAHGDSSGFASSVIQSATSRKRRDNDGPIIFYNRAKFCTDLSGDGQSFSAANPAVSKTSTTQPLGAAPSPLPVKHVPSEICEPRGPFDNVSMDTEMIESEKPSSSEEELGFSPESLRNDSGSESADIMDFEASGLGGVRPDDNFGIEVRRSQVQTAPSTSTYTQQRKAYGYPQKILEALEEQSVLEGANCRKEPHVITEKILSTSRKSLPSSTLPPASFLDSTYSYDIESDCVSDVSSGPSSSDFSDEQLEPSTALQLLKIAPPAHVGSTHAVAKDPPTISSEEEYSEKDFDFDDDDNDDDDGSVDFLATARRLDPTSVRASEREYDAVVADRLAENIPAGSSAATAGGGSGFNTPQKGMAIIQEDVESLDSNMDMPSTSDACATSKTRNLKRTGTSESDLASLHLQKLQKKD